VAHPTLTVSYSGFQYMDGPGVENCRRLGLPIRRYLCDILAGLANRSIQTLAGITPTAYTARQTKAQGANAASGDRQNYAYLGPTGRGTGVSRRQGPDSSRIGYDRRTPSSELFALRWKCFDAEISSLDLQETVYRGKLRNHGKTKKSLTKIHISSLMVSDLQAWKIICPGSSPEAFIFPNREGGVRDPNNFRRRVLGQLREKLSLPKLTFQVIRRTMATLSQTKGGVKDTQGMLRHARLPTTTDVYMQVIPEGVEQMINSMDVELRNRHWNPYHQAGYAIMPAGMPSEKVEAKLTPIDRRPMESFDISR
jgi:hypothetical protein